MSVVGQFIERELTKMDVIDEADVDPPEARNSKTDPEAAENEPSICAVCREEMGVDTIILPCKHVFHVSCAWKTLASTVGKCPVCKAVTLTKEDMGETKRLQEERITIEHTFELPAVPLDPIPRRHLGGSVPRLRSRSGFLCPVHGERFPCQECLHSPGGWLSIQSGARPVTIGTRIVVGGRQGRVVALGPTKPISGANVEQGVSCGMIWMALITVAVTVLAILTAVPLFNSH